MSKNNCERRDLWINPQDKGKTCLELDVIEPCRRCQGKSEFEILRDEAINEQCFSDAEKEVVCALTAAAESWSNAAKNLNLKGDGFYKEISSAYLKAAKLLLKVGFKTLDPED